MKKNTAVAGALYSLWEYAVANSSPGFTPDTWNEQVKNLSQRGIGMEAALRFLYGERPAFEQFVTWIEANTKELQAEEYHEDVLSKEELDFWNKNGYVVIKDAVSAEQCSAAGKAIWEFLDAQPHHADSWYKQHPAKNGLMLSFFDHPALDATRKSARIKKAYHQLYGDTDIYLLIDKVSFNPPETDGFKFLGSPLHWDVSLQLPIPFELQGLLYLDDVNEADGAFHCVPGFHQEIEGWLNNIPAGVNPRHEALNTLKPVPVPGNAGDLVIWHQALPHCATPNRGNKPRLVQYIAYKPVKASRQVEWI